MDSNKITSQRKVTSFIKKRLKPAYLLFFILPLAYCFVSWETNSSQIVDNTKYYDYLSFSIRSSNPARLALVENQREKILWDINSKAYKNLEIVDQINSDKGINFTATNLNTNDTLSFLGINFYSNNKLYSLDNNIKEHITVTNARFDEKNGVFLLIVERTGTPVTITLTSPEDWGNREPFNAKTLIIILVFLLAFLFVIVINPSPGYFVLSMVFAIFVLAFGYFTVNNSNGRVTISSSSKIKNAEIFYSQTPFFSALKRYSSEKITDVFSQPVNLETEKYLRFDIGDSLIQLNQIKIKISSGFFSKSYNLSELPQNRLVLNDMILVGNIYHITGNDPYIRFSSIYFTGKLEFLLFLEHNKFLFLTLVVLLILISLHWFLDKKVQRLKLKPAYLAFLLIPLAYYQINQHWVKKSTPQGSDYLYFSVKSSHPSVITLVNGSDSVTSWFVDAPGFKYLQYKGRFNINENFFFKVTGLLQQDTISFLSINIFHNDHIYSLFEKNNSLCKITNADYVDQSKNFDVVIKKSGLPVFIRLLPTNLLEKNNQEINSRALLVLITFFTFLIVLLYSPNQWFFIISVMVTSVMMIVFFMLSSDIQSHLILKTSSPANRADFFYNNNPQFVPKRSHIDLTGKSTFKFQIMPDEFKFFRCDIGDDKEKINDLAIGAEFGILKTNWDYRTISSDKILLNDLIRSGNQFIVCGNDPFIVLSSAYQANKIQNFVSVRQNLFFFMSLLLFLILIISDKYFTTNKRPGFFLVVFFFSFISAGLVIHLFNSETRVLLFENRSANKFPAFQIDSTVNFTKGLDNYILDQLPGRKNSIKMNCLMQFFVFKQLVNNQVIHFGDDGWMFYIAGPAKENFENRQPLTIQELEKIKGVLVARNEWLKKRGIHFYLIFPPMPQSIYKEYVGLRLRQYYKQTKSEQLIEYLKLNSDLDVIDVYTPLMKAKYSGYSKPYYKNNCHWNYYGGYIGYCTVINYIKKDFPNIGDPLTTKDFNWVESEDFKPDLLRLMDIDKFYKFTEIAPKFVDNIITDTIYPFYLDLWTPAPPAIIRTKRVNYPSMLMYGDSYAGALLKFLFCNFSKSTFIWTPLFHPLIIEKEKPDMVIQEMVDVSISNILLKNKPLPELKDSI